MSVARYKSNTQEVDVVHFTVGNKNAVIRFLEDSETMVWIRCSLEDEYNILCLDKDGFSHQLFENCYVLFNGEVIEVMEPEDFEEQYTLIREPVVSGECVSPIIVENEHNSDTVYRLDITDINGTFTTPNLMGGGDGTAESTTYTAPASAPVVPDTQAQPENVQQALDVIMNEIFYTPVRIGRFDMNPGATTYEVGQSTGELTFTWSISPVDAITSVKFNNQEIPKTQTSITQPSVSTDSRYTLTITDGSGREGSTATSTKSISFLPKIYFGSAALGNVDSAFVIGLPQSKLASNYRGTYSFTVNNQEYGWFAFPSNFNAPSSCYIGGFETTLEKASSSLQVTNQYGDTRSYVVYRTSQMGLGSIKAEFR